MAKTLDEGFSTFLDWLVPATSEQDAARSHKDSVKACLESNFGCSNFFETGSFGAGTGIRHYSDTDYFAVIPKINLNDNSSIALRLIREKIEKKFSTTDGIVVNCPAVKIPFGVWASERMEVTPALPKGKVESNGGTFNNFEIPDCEGGWMQSSPGAHNNYVQKIDNKLSGKAKQLIRLVKAWKYYNDVPIISFFLELYVARFCDGESVIVFYLDLATIFEKLEKDGLPGMYDPMGISGHVKPCKSTAQHTEALSKVKTAANRARRAADQISKGDLDAAFATYDLLFNSNFPAR